MNRLHQGLLLGSVLIAVALLAVFDFVPEAVAQYAPLAVVPFIVSRRPFCRSMSKGQAA